MGTLIVAPALAHRRGRSLEVPRRGALGSRGGDRGRLAPLGLVEVLRVQGAGGLGGLVEGLRSCSGARA
eukprot:1918217-Pyramimonas_sp.AAC.1